jgi:hypothetical protein
LEKLAIARGTRSPGVSPEKPDGVVRQVRLVEIPVLHRQRSHWTLGQLLHLVKRRLEADDGREALAAVDSGAIAWAPDDKAIIYSTVERTNVWRRSLADGRETRVTNFTDLAILRFALSPDGRTLLLCRGTTLRDAFLISGFR